MENIGEKDGKKLIEKNGVTDTKCVIRMNKKCEKSDSVLCITNKLP